MTTILVLEQTTGDADRLSESLARMGHRVTRAYADREPCLAANDPRPALVVADVSRRGSPTLNAARKLESVDGIPIIVTTSLPYLELDEPLSRIPGVRAVLFTPCSDVTLRRTVEEAIESLP